MPSRVWRVLFLQSTQGIVLNLHCDGLGLPIDRITLAQRHYLRQIAAALLQDVQLRQIAADQLQIVQLRQIVAALLQIVQRRQIVAELLQIVQLRQIAWQQIAWQQQAPLVATRCIPPRATPCNCYWAAMKGHS